MSQQSDAASSGLGSASVRPSATTATYQDAWYIGGYPGMLPEKVLVEPTHGFRTDGHYHIVGRGPWTDDHGTFGTVFFADLLPALEASLQRALDQRVINRRSLDNTELLVQRLRAAILTQS